VEIESLSESRSMAGAARAYPRRWRVTRLDPTSPRRRCSYRVIRQLRRDSGLKCAEKRPAGHRAPAWIFTICRGQCELDRPVSPLPRKSSSLIAATVLAATVVMSGCTAGSNPLTDTPANALCCTELGGTSAGLWLGLWHGLIAPVTFFVSLFSSGTSVYEVRNNGGWYNAGFLLGLMTVSAGQAGPTPNTGERPTRMKARMRTGTRMNEDPRRTWTRGWRLSNPALNLTALRAAG
jgi:hypothetical protein